MVGEYIPSQGDICFVSLDPAKGFEKIGYRPVIVISSHFFSKMTNMAIVCPITTKIREFPTHYELQNTKEVFGSVDAEHIRSIDFRERKFKYIEKIGPLEFTEIFSLLMSEIDFDMNTIKE